MASSTDELTEMGEAAHTAIRKNIVQLSKGITVGDIPLTLYAEGFLKDPTWELLTIREIPDSQRAAKVVLDVQNVVSTRPDMLQLFCKILSHDKVSENLAKAIHGK